LIPLNIILVLSFINEKKNMIKKKNLTKNN